MNGKEIKICSVCPGACPWDAAGKADECKDCLFKNIDCQKVDCQKVDCGNCIAGKAVMVAEGVAELKEGNK